MKIKRCNLYHTAFYLKEYNSVIMQRMRNTDNLFKNTDWEVWLKETIVYRAHTCFMVKKSLKMII